MERQIPIGALLKIASNEIEQSMNARVTDVGLTAAQSHVLHYICRNSGRVHQRDVEREFGLSHATVSGLIDRLESKGFLRRARGEADARCMALFATDTALEFEERIHGLILETEAQMLSGFTAMQTEALRAALMKILSNSGFVLPERDPCEEENV